MARCRSGSAKKLIKSQDGPLLLATQLLRTNISRVLDSFARQLAFMARSSSGSGGDGSDSARAATVRCLSATIVTSAAKLHAASVCDDWADAEETATCKIWPAAQCPSVWQANVYCPAAAKANTSGEATSPPTSVAFVGSQPPVGCSHTSWLVLYVNWMVSPTVAVCARCGRAIHSTAMLLRCLPPPPGTRAFDASAPDTFENGCGKLIVVASGRSRKAWPLV